MESTHCQKKTQYKRNKKRFNPKNMIARDGFKIKINNYTISRQTLVILFLGIIAIIGETTTFLILFYTNNYDVGIITALITFTSGITGGFVGYLNGKETTPQGDIVEEQDYAE